MSEVANDNHAPIPVTVLTGFLGAGKTTLLKYLLQAEHGMKIAVIENEYSETPIDGQLLGVEPVQVMTLSNGCVCCSINTDLEKALFLLLERRDNGEIDFDRLVIECTGLADPAPVAQTFFADEELCQRYVLDGIITLVDAANAERHLQETIAQAQVGFADRILLSKTDLVDAANGSTGGRWCMWSSTAASTWRTCSTYVASTSTPTSVLASACARCERWQPRIAAIASAPWYCAATRRSISKG